MLGIFVFLFIKNIKLIRIIFKLDVFMKTSFIFFVRNEKQLNVLFYYLFINLQL